MAFNSRPSAYNASTGNNNFHNYNNRHGAPQVYALRHGAAPARQPVSAGGMTFIPTRTATNMPTAEHQQEYIPIGSMHAQGHHQAFPQEAWMPHSFYQLQHLAAANAFGPPAAIDNYHQSQYQNHDAQPQEMPVAGVKFLSTQQQAKQRSQSNMKQLQSIDGNLPQSSHHHQGHQHRPMSMLDPPQFSLSSGGSSSICPHQHQSQQQNLPCFTPIAAMQAPAAAGEALRPSQLPSGAWSNERKLRGGGAATPDASSSSGEMVYSTSGRKQLNLREEATRASTSTKNVMVATKEDEDGNTSDASSINLNDTFTRDPYEAQENKVAEREARRSSRNNTPAVHAAIVGALSSKTTPFDELKSKGASPTASSIDPWSAWTVESSSASPLNYAAPPTPIRSQGLWAYDSMASTSNVSLLLPSSSLPTPNNTAASSVANSRVVSPMSMSMLPIGVQPCRKIGATAPVPPPFELPPPVAPTSGATAAQGTKSYLAASKKGAHNSSNRSATTTTAPPPAYNSGKKSYPTISQWFASNGSPSVDTTSTPPSVVKPGAMTVEDLENSLHQSRGPSSSFSPIISAPATPGADTTTTDEDEGKFKVHRYRGPRHCRACRFHSKSLHAQVVLTRDLNLRYKLDMTCKVCDETFEKCVDDKEWQNLWDKHCKSRTHYRKSLDETGNGAKAAARRSFASSPTVAGNSSSSPQRCFSAEPTTPDRQMLFGSSLEQPATTRASRKSATAALGNSGGRPTVGTLFERPAKTTDVAPKNIMASFVADTSDPAVSFDNCRSSTRFGGGLSNRAVKKPTTASMDAAEDSDSDEEVVVFMPAF